MKHHQIAAATVAIALFGVSTACIVAKQQAQSTSAMRDPSDTLPHAWKSIAPGVSVPATQAEIDAASRGLHERPDSPRLTMPILPSGKQATSYWAGGGETCASDDDGHEYRHGLNGWIPVYR